LNTQKFIKFLFSRAKAFQKILEITFRKRILADNEPNMKTADKNGLFNLPKEEQEKFIN
jgi:hypothetical protein